MEQREERRQLVQDLRRTLRRNVVIAAINSAMGVIVMVIIAIQAIGNYWEKRQFRAAIAEVQSATKAATIGTVELTLGQKIDLREWATKNGVSLSGNWWYTSSPHRLDVKDGVVLTIWPGEGYVCVQPSVTQAKPFSCVLVRVLPQPTTPVEKGG